ncbi:MAG: hypothetical protein HKM93_13175 [Desulfobacteraceae bacterium]|nr:hypothetical protein [Desulfobacteraceae bacterium]
MGFKENLLEKITINALVRRIIQSWGSPESGQRLDTSAIRDLLAMTEYQKRKERDIELYVKPGFSDSGRILVLDNELKIYDTTIADVALRKSPTVKEMISIRNAIKILNDKDVVVSRKKDTVLAIQKELIDGLDLSFSPADIQGIAADGKDSLANTYADGVWEAVVLFAELLHYRPAPKVFQKMHFKIVGTVDKAPGNAPSFGPVVGYSLIQNTLFCMDHTYDSGNRRDMTSYHDMLNGNETATIAGPAVFDRLSSSVTV